VNHPLFKKYISESWLLFLALAIGVFAFGWFRVWIVGELDTASFRQIIDLIPKDWCPTSVEHQLDSMNRC
jgi:ABC-2 type transport system permease protein